MRRAFAPLPGKILLLLALGMFTSRSPSEAASLVRGPYLQRPSDTVIEVLWTTSSPDLGSVAYRPDALAGQPRKEVLAGGGSSDDGMARRSWMIAGGAGPQEFHRVVLPDLAPGIVYEYEILGDGSALSPAFRFRASRCPGDPSLAFGVIGDTTGGTVPAAIAEQLSGRGMDLVLHVGDVVYPDGRPGDYDSNFFSPFAPLLAAAPIMPILGDHDVRTANGAPFFEAFDLPSNGITADPRFYSFRQGEAEFFCLDVESSAFGEDSGQYLWLERGLAASTANWKFVTVFEPPFSSGNSNVIEQIVLSPLFERYGVDLVFSGHEHLYERTRPICVSGPPDAPVVYIVEGGGGASVSTFDPESFSAFLAAVHGYVTVRIEKGSLLLEAHDVGGSIIDSTTLVKVPKAGASDENCSLDGAAGGAAAAR